MKAKPLPSQEKIKEKLSYNPDTGLSVWVSNGELASKITSNGYRRVFLYGSYYKHARVAFKFMTGRDPVNDMDHGDLNRSNDKWSNLSDLTKSENMCNAEIRKHNKSGYRGVSWDKANNKYVAQIRSNAINYHLGYFEDPELASEVFRDCREVLNQIGN